MENQCLHRDISGLEKKQLLMSKFTDLRTNPKKLKSMAIAPDHKQGEFFLS